MSDLYDPTHAHRRNSAAIDPSSGQPAGPLRLGSAVRPGLLTSMDIQPPAGDDLAGSLAKDQTLAECVLRNVEHGQLDFVRSWTQLENVSPQLRSYNVSERLRSHSQASRGQPFSPWLYLSYYRIGRHLASGADPAALPVSGEELLRQVEQRPPGSVLAFADPGAAPEEQWLALVELFQEGGDFLPDLDAPAAGDYVLLAAAVTEARGLIRLGDPGLEARMQQLLPVVILALPGPAARLQSRSFGGATAFFFGAAASPCQPRAHSGHPAGGPRA